MGNVYAVSFSTAAVGAALPIDLFEITASTQANIRLLGVAVSRVSTAAVGTTGADQALLQVLRGSSAGGSTSTGVIFNMDSRSRSTAKFAASVVSSNIGSAGSTVAVMLNAIFHGLNGQFAWFPDRESAPIAKLGERLSVRIGPRASAYSMTGTAYVEEIGKAPGIGDR